ncbi:hypothetical protein T4C_9034 [Trichinella pseudospiralis]|uniref:Uncharacterized protein n=1 Tax=Trichinella pseudospiralis TaxID=6337 RepID=A0A0V1K4W4_TRIPS|nr:hypothetical protein T4C_9034 [Trichinella pseudospiralis]
MAIADFISLAFIRNQLLSAMHSIVMGQVRCGFFELPLRHLNVTIDTQDEKVEASDNVSCKANTEGKATHKNLHENSGKQVICCQLDSTLLSTTLETLSMALTLPLCLKSTREGSYDAIILPGECYLRHVFLPTPNPTILSECPLNTVCSPISVSNTPELSPYSRIPPYPTTLSECYLSLVKLVRSHRQQSSMNPVSKRLLHKDA